MFSYARWLCAISPVIVFLVAKKMFHLPMLPGVLLIIAVCTPLCLLANRMERRRHAR